MISPAPLQAARWAARILLDDDPDWFVGGCAEVAETIAAFAKRLNLRGVTAEYGHSAAPAGTLPHAWLRVGGRIYDPRADVEGISFGRYRVSPSVCAILGGLDDLDAIERRVEMLLERWRSSTLEDKRSILSKEWLREQRDRLDYGDDD